MLAQANIPRALSHGQLCPAPSPSPCSQQQHHLTTTCQPHHHHQHHRSELFLERSEGWGGSGRSTPPSAGSVVRSTLDLALAAVVKQEPLQAARASLGGDGASAGLKHWEPRQAAAAAVADTSAVSLGQ